MKKYQLVESFGNYKHAGSKATNDAVEIVFKLGFEPLLLEKIEYQKSVVNKVKRQIKIYKNWKKIYSNIEDNSILFIQNPFYTKDYFRFVFLKKLKSKKNIKIISLVHDVEPIRKMFNTKYLYQEFNEMLEIADKLIIHNESMMQWFIDYGVRNDKLINLEIFDYLSQGQSDKKVEFSKRIQIAGNLDKSKSPYIYALDKINKVKFDLFGINYSGKENENIEYHGSFSPEEIMNQLITGFGLVWDGEKIDTCSGITGNYLRFNNPHKLSLYLASGLPVIVWSESAEAEFVLKYNVGFVVDSLDSLYKELENFSNKEYEKMLLNVKNIREKIINGEFLKKGVFKAMKNLKLENEVERK